jgi:hypothetical protein
MHLEVTSRRAQKTNTPRILETFNMIIPTSLGARRPVGGQDRRREDLRGVIALATFLHVICRRPCHEDEFHSIMKSWTRRRR